MPYGVMGRAYIGYASVSEVNEVLADTECTNSKIFEYLCLMAETRAQIEEIVNRVIQLVDLSIAIERRDASGGYDVAGHTGEWEAGEHDSPHTTLVMMRRSRPETEFFAVVLAHAAERILIDTDGTERKIIEAACRAAIEAGATIT